MEDKVAWLDFKIDSSQEKFPLPVLIIWKFFADHERFIDQEPFYGESHCLDSDNKLGKFLLFFQSWCNLPHQRMCFCIVGVLWISLMSKHVCCAVLILNFLLSSPEQKYKRERYESRQVLPCLSNSHPPALVGTFLQILITGRGQGRQTK